MKAKGLEMVNYGTEVKNAQMFGITEVRAALVYRRDSKARRQLTNIESLRIALVSLSLSDIYN